MNSNNLSSLSLEKAIKLPLSERIILKAKACLEEDASYAADELVELAEELLHHITAVGFAHYLKSNIQKEVYNDFLLQLFTSSGHDYNAGPLYRWAANMIQDSLELRQSKQFRFFWDNKEDKEVLCERVHSLAELRNRVMHGFFVLPPDENRRQADFIGNLLIELHESDFFQSDADFHFIKNGNFTGNWSIQQESDWKLLESDSSFGKLIAQIQTERSDMFWKKEQQNIEHYANAQIVLPDGFESFIQNNERGALACWVHPNDNHAVGIYANMAQYLQNKNEMLTIAYTLHDTGISYTGGFILERLAKLLNTNNKPLSSNKKTEDHVKQLRAAYKGKVIILVNNIHTALFSKQHITRLNNFLFENNILLVGVGHHYEHFNTFFNQTITIVHPTAVPDANQRAAILHNYLRFKGPHSDKKEDMEDVKALRTILDKLCDSLEQGGEVYARRFADENEYDMEYVHEIFALLHPWVKHYRKPFEEDTIDELYGFPTNITETTPIYLALGRRDVKLEYQHKVISL